MVPSPSRNSAERLSDVMIVCSAMECSPSEFFTVARGHYLRRALRARKPPFVACTPSERRSGSSAFRPMPLRINTAKQIIAFFARAASGRWRASATMSPTVESGGLPGRMPPGSHARRIDTRNPEGSPPVKRGLQDGADRPGMHTQSPPAPCRRLDVFQYMVGNHPKSKWSSG